MRAQAEPYRPGGERDADGGERRRGPRRSVTVTGHGSASAVPDVVVAELAAEVTTDDVQVALDLAAGGLARLRDALLAAGVAEADLRTTQTSTWTHQREPRPGEGEGARPAATARFGLRATLRGELGAPARAGGVVQQALAAAGQEARLDGISFAVADAAPLAAAARDAAFADARAKGEQYAALAGLTLGTVLDVREDDAATPVPRLARAVASAKAAPALTVDGGTQDVTAAVTVRFALEETSRQDGPEQAAAV